MNKISVILNFGDYMNELTIETLSATFYFGAKETLSPLWHDKNVISPNSKVYYVLDGELIVETETEVLLAKKGDMILLPAGVKHNFYLTEKKYAVKYWFHFDLKAGNESFFENYNFPYKIHVGINSHLSNLFDVAISRASGRNANDTLAASGMVMAIVSYYFDHCAYTEKKYTADEIDTLIKLVKNNYSENYSLEDLAKHVNLSPNYFVKKFKKRTGHSPMQFIKIIKLERAKFLLEQSNKSVNSIMEQTGFLDSAHFSKIFKARYGHSPKKFREIYKCNTN